MAPDLAVEVLSQELGLDDGLDGEDVVPGFSCRLAEILK